MFVRLNSGDLIMDDFLSEFCDAEFMMHYFMHLFSCTICSTLFCCGLNTINTEVHCSLLNCIEEFLANNSYHA